jgi:hypothetical protein
MKLQQEKHELELEVQDAEWRVDQGQAPNVSRSIVHNEVLYRDAHLFCCGHHQEDAELEWQRLVRDAAYRRGVEEQQAQQQAVPTDAFAPAQITRTTAEPRPNAYIPDDIGIPKPYGAYTVAERARACADSSLLSAGSLAPFKPSATGRGLSHMRAPRVQPVEI